MERLHPNCTIATVPGFPGGGEFTGRDAAAEFVRGFIDAWENARYEYSDTRVVNGRVVHAARWIVEGKASGVETTLDFYGVARMEDAKFAEMSLFWTEEVALEHARAAR